MKKIDSMTTVPISEIMMDLENGMELYASWSESYMRLCRMKHEGGVKDTVLWHKERLGQQDFAWCGSEFRQWIWQTDDWRVFVSNKQGISFEVRAGLDIKAALAAWQDYLTRMGVE